MKEKRLVNTETKEHFKRNWSKYDPDATSFILVSDLPNLLLDLGEPLGWDSTFKSDHLKQYNFITEMNLLSYHNSQHYNFIEVLENLAMLLILNMEIDKYMKEVSRVESIGRVK